MPADPDLTARLDALLTQRLTALGIGQSPVNSIAPAPQAFVAPALNSVAPALLLLRVKIPVAGAETGGYLGFALPTNCSASVVQALTEQIAATWPIETFRPRDSGWSNGGYRRQHNRSYNSGYRGRW